MEYGTVKEPTQDGNTLYQVSKTNEIPLYPHCLFDFMTNYVSFIYLLK